MWIHLLYITYRYIYIFISVCKEELNCIINIWLVSSVCFILEQQGQAIRYQSAHDDEKSLWQKVGWHFAVMCMQLSEHSSYRCGFPLNFNSLAFVPSLHFFTYFHPSSTAHCQVWKMYLPESQIIKQSTATINTSNHQQPKVHFRSPESSAG